MMPHGTPDAAALPPIVGAPVEGRRMERKWLHQAAVCVAVLLPATAARGQ